MTIPFAEKASASAAAILSCLRQDLAYTAKLCDDAGITALPYPAAAAYQALMDEARNGRDYDFVILSRKLRESGPANNGASPEALQAILYADHPLTSLPQHIRAFAEAEAARKLHELGRELTEGALDSHASASALLVSAGERLAGISLTKPRPNLPLWRDALDLVLHKPEKPAELVMGLLHRGAKLVLGGASKSNKTWSLLDLAVSVATGRDWWGMPVIRGKVLYLNLEIAESFFAWRIHHILEAKDTAIDAGDLTVWNLRGHSCDMGRLSHQILPEIKDRGFSLIVLDPIYKCLGDRDENKAGEIASLLNHIERIAVECNAAVAFGAHYSKGNQSGKESIDRIGGSGVFSRDPDAILTLTKHEEDEAFTCEPTLRNHAPHPPFVLRWDWPLMRPDAELDPTKLKQVGGAGRKATWTTDDLVEHLGEREVGSADFQRKVEKECGMSRATFWRLIKVAMREKLIVKSKLSDAYFKP